MSPRHVPLKAGLSLLALGIALVLGAPPAAAQTADCAAALATAEARYTEGAFEAVEPLLPPCLDGTDQAVPAYRLLALARLRQGDVVGAKLAVLRILALRPTYAVNVVQEPPDYVALVQVVRDQLAVAQDPSPPPAQGDEAPVPWARVSTRTPMPLPSPAPPALPVGAPPPASVSAPPSGTEVALHTWIGAGSYGGERGVAASTPIPEFADNAGIAAGAGGTVAPWAWLRAYAELGLNYYPTLPTDKGDNFVYEPLDEVTLSAYVYSLTAGVHLVPFRRGGVAPYLFVGGGAAVGRGGRAGGLGTFGGGMDGRLGTATELFIEGSGTLVTPARALDAASWPDAKTDLLSGVRIGLRYRVTR